MRTSFEGGLGGSDEEMLCASCEEFGRCTSGLPVVSTVGLCTLLLYYFYYLQADTYWVYYVLLSARVWDRFSGLLVTMLDSKPDS